LCRPTGISACLPCAICNRFRSTNTGADGASRSLHRTTHTPAPKSSRPGEGLQVRCQDGGPVDFTASAVRICPASVPFATLATPNGIRPPNGMERSYAPFEAPAKGLRRFYAFSHRFWPDWVPFPPCYYWGKPASTPPTCAQGRPSSDLLAVNFATKEQRLQRNLARSNTVTLPLTSP